MLAPIQTNELVYNLDLDALEKTYDVIAIRTNKLFFKDGAYILDAPILNNAVLSVSFEKGDTFYVLAKHNELNKGLLKEAIANTPEVEDITIQDVSFDALDARKIISLLLNSLGNFKSESLRFNNLTGHLYCFHPKWIKHSSKEENIIFKIPCLEISVTKTLCLRLTVHTFTSSLLKKDIVFDKKPWKSYPKYVLSAHYTLRRKLNEDSQMEFIMRQTKGKKTQIPFCNIQSEALFSESKMGVLASVLKMFNQNFEGLAHLEFQKIEEYVSLDFTRSIAKENEQRIHDLLTEKPIKIIDCIDDKYSKMFCKDIETLLYEKYDVTVSFGKRVSKTHLNIRVIHNAAYYEGENDPHHAFTDAAVQHITFEDFSNSSEFAVSTVIHEMLIKEDLKNHKITLFPWERLGFSEDIAFGVEWHEKYYFMNIHPDGSFDVKEQTLNLFEENTYSKCVDIFETAKLNSENIKGLIREQNGNITTIKDTEKFTIPEIFQIQTELSQGNTKLRGKESRNQLLSSCLDIKMFHQDNAEYYFVGTIGNGMRVSLPTAANIRKIEPYESNESIFEKLLPLMNVSFIHNGQLTVVPFPFKYLREYLKQINEI